MKVSVITVAYNSEDTIEQCIQSVLGQDYPDLELIIVDGKSTDGTMNIITKYSERIASVISESDNGIYDAMNKGLSLCTGEVIGILNSDDMYQDAQVISDVVNKMQKREVESCYSNLVYVDRRNPEKVVRTWESGTYRRDLFLKGWMPPHPTFFLKRRYYEKYGLFNLNFRTSADYELMLRMLFKHRISTVYLNRTTVRMRTGGQSNASMMNRVKANLEDRRAWKVNGLSPGFFTILRKPISKLGQFFKK